MIIMMVGAIESPTHFGHWQDVLGIIIQSPEAKLNELTASQVDPPDAVMRAQVRRIREAKLRTEREKFIA